ncbi:metal ABC transporter ATP-binding protein [Cohnella endophytica]|uniref:Metal ABC transporter ATP-binding protein n=1 Tax=Cohnella endophytica TaxID=2419778 RepID=A0A494YC24_9BACL|nr:metal ABC transporter ATP-binding protein [Cohnella endophytica]RKP58216.1 metal ABC transporter ATP-binding protein [Cohnella endophytica]
MELVSLRNVTFGYGDVPCLQDASLEIHAGEFIAVTGPNGAAKSTLLKLALKLLRPWQGDVTLSMRNVSGGKLVIGYVPQQISAFNAGFPSTVWEFVQSGRFRQGAWLRRLNDVDREATEQALRQVGMWEFRKRKIGELSGGQKQKIILARAFAMEPDLLVLDEPTTGMDAESRQQFYRLLKDQVRLHGRTVMMVTHHLAEVEGDLDRLITLERKEEGGWKCCTTTSCSGHFVPAG